MINKIIDFCDNFWDGLLNLKDWLLDGLLYILSKVLFFVFDAFCSVVETLITAIDFTQLTALSAFGDWNLLPPQILYILSQLHIGQCLTMLAAACLIRLILNLIPAALTRV